MKRGQAAVEFLMTYGWAILALILVIAVLLSSGIWTPNYLISEECSFGNSLRCNFAMFNEGGSTKMLMEFFNGFPYEIRIVKLELQTRDGTQQFSGFEGDVTLASGESKVFEGTLSGPEVSEGNIKRFSGNITYVLCAPELDGCSTSEHVITGRVVGKIIPQ